MSPTAWMTLTNTVIAAVIIGSATTIAARNPVLAGFITALPLSSLLALSLMYVRTGDGSATARYALSIIVALPVSLLFFAPFLVYGRLKGSIWLYLLAGLAMLWLGYFIQRAVATRFLGS